MHTYRFVADEGKPDDQGFYQVGYYVPAGYEFRHSPRWMTLSVHGTEKEAIWRVNCLNGGGPFYSGKE